MPDVKTIAVIGAGQMGGGIAQVAATSGVAALVYDAVPASLERCKANHGSFLARSVEKGKMAQADADAALARIRYVSDLSDLASADWVVEAIVEDLPAKQRLLSRLPDLAPDPTPIEETYVMHVQDTIGVGFDVIPFSAVGVASGSEVDGEFAFAGWDPEAADGAEVADLNSGSIDLDRYYEFTFTPRPGMAMHATNMTFEVRRSNNGPRSFAVRTGPGFGTNLSLSGGAAIQVNSVGAHFVADDDPAHRRGNNLAHLTAQIAGERLGQAESEPAGALRVHQDPRALQIIGTMASRGEDEVTFKQRAAGAEFG